MPFFIGLGARAGHLGGGRWKLPLAGQSVCFLCQCVQAVHPDLPDTVTPRPRKAWSEVETVKSDTASLISFRSAVQCWLTSCSKCLGKVSSTWVTRGSFRCTAVCMECQECIANKGLAFRFESYGGEELHIFKSGVPLAACSILLNALHCFLFL